MNKNVTTVATKVTGGTPATTIEESVFLSILREAISVSPLAVGEKFETDELVRAKDVRLKDVDIVEYHSDKDGDVRYAVWSVTADGVDGWYASGVVLTNLADTIIENDMLDALREYGIKVTLTMDKTRGGNSIVRVTL